MIRKLLLIPALVLLTGSALAQQLKPPPVPPESQDRFSATSYPYLWISGLAPDGNIAGVVVYYSPCAGRGCHQTYTGALVEWDWLGTPMFISLCPGNPRLPWSYCPPRAPHDPSYEVVNGYTFWPELEGPNGLEAGFIQNNSWITSN